VPLRLSCRSAARASCGAERIQQPHTGAHKVIRIPCHLRQVMQQGNGGEASAWC
jgi:hypothetical protein